MNIIRDLVEHLEIMAALGKPQKNAYVERFNRAVRHEWLIQHLFKSMAHAQETATEWLWRYNNERPHIRLLTGGNCSCPDAGGGGMTSNFERNY